MSKKISTPLKNFSEFKKEHSLANELPFWDFFENSLALSDGTLICGLKIEGICIETFSDDKINSLAKNLRSFLNGLNDETEISFYVDSNFNYSEILKNHESLKSNIENINSITDDRLNMLESEIKDESILNRDTCLFVYKRTDYKNKNSISNLFSSPLKFKSVSKKEHDKRLKNLLQTTASISKELEQMEIKSKILNKDKIKELIYKFLNPQRSKYIDTPVENNNHKELEFTPDELNLMPELSLSSPREQLVFSDLICTYKDIFFDEYYHRVLTLKTLPEYTHASLISKLMELSMPYSLFIHIKVPVQSKELSILQTKRKMAHSMVNSSNGGACDLESQSQVNSTEDLLREIIESGQKIFFFQLVVVVKDKSIDKLNIKANSTLNSFRRLNGAEALEETTGAFKTFKTTIPFANLNMKRAKRIKTDNLADFLPIYSFYQGLKQRPVCIFRNRQNSLVKYDPFDLQFLNYNTLVTGSSGSGKSFLNNLIILQSLKTNPITFIIDIGGSYRKLCKFVNGQYVDIAPLSDKRDIVFNPFYLSEKSLSSRKIKFLLAFLEIILTDQEDKKLTKLQKAMLEEQINVLYKKFKNPKLSNLKKLLESSNERDLNVFAKMLYPWTGDRVYGKLLDNENSFDFENEFVVFDLKGLSSFPDLQSAIILIITDFILGKIESDNYKLKNKRILMDECWELLKGKSSSHFMEYCVRTLRKAGAGITFITQGIEEIYNHEIGSAILNNTATKFILMQKGDLKPIKDILKLNEKEMSLVSSLKSIKREYSETFMINNDNKAVVRVYPSDEEYKIATTDFEDKKIPD